MTPGARLTALTLMLGTLLAGAATGTAAIGHAATRTGHAATAAARGISAREAAVTIRQQAAVRRYWTASRMEHAAATRQARTRQARQARTRQARTRQARAHDIARAVPLSAVTDGARWNGGEAVARTTGKVFFSLSGHDYVCSGSTVASANYDVVVTAAHCVKNGPGAWATNWTFVPGYVDGRAPYGSYSAHMFYVSSQWSTAGNNDYDVAFVTVNPVRADGALIPVVRAVGGQGIEFGSSPARVTVFGYPADPPYNGQLLYYCSGSTSPDPYHQTGDAGLSCAMTAGSSGGPWLSGFDRATGTGYITSVSSFKYSTNDQVMYGPQLGAAAEAVYQAAEHG
jgi:V8-like Glu-specific endopeptidase